MSYSSESCMVSKEKAESIRAKEAKKMKQTEAMKRVFNQYLERQKAKKEGS